ncbi:MAG TPA: response regulator [Candidatus Saccharimonadales bacterium]|nr:response regulator [Candidatus Saccharimonadales bacterium]
MQKSSEGQAAKKILIIEDDTSLVKVLRDSLTREGYVVLETRSGKTGLGIALTQHPDLILLDIVLPDLDGISIVKAIHDDPAGQKIKVIMLTNLSDTQNVAEALVNGSYDFLVKSDWKIDDVIKVVREKLAG